MPRTRKPASIPADVTEFYASALRAINKTVSMYLSHVQTPGKNISNWATQLFGNDPARTFSIAVTVAGEEIEISHVENFQPCGKSDSGDYLGLLGNGQLPELTDATIYLIGYLLSTFFVGKIMSVVTAGRAAILYNLLNDLNVTALTFTVHNVHMGGVVTDTNPNVDMTYTLPEIMGLLKGFSGLTTRITDLPKKSGKATVRTGTTLKPALKAKVMRKPSSI